MRSILLLALGLLSACALPSPHVPSGGLAPESLSRSPQGSRDRPPIGNGYFYLTAGARTLEDSRWGSLDDQGALGVDFTLKNPSSPIGLNFGLAGAGNRERVGTVDLDAWQIEATVGPRLYLMLPDLPIYLYGGVGAAIVYGELETPTRRTSDTQFAGMASAGLIYQLNRYQGIGLEWRTLQGTDFDSGVPGGPNDSNYQQLALTFSTTF